MTRSTNPAFGFYGEMSRQNGIEAEQAWSLALAAIVAATGCPAADVQPFLDSRHGRHFGDEVCNGLHDGLGLAAAIDHAVSRWMGWRISRRTDTQLGIPAGLPYLTGFVQHCLILAESD